MPKVPTSETGTATLGIDRGRNVSQKQENRHHDEGDGEQERKFHVAHRGADRRGAVGENGNINRRGQVGLDLRQKLFDAVNDLDDVRAGLALDVDDDRRRLVHPRRELRVFHVVNHVRHVGQNHRRAILIRDDERAVILAGEKLIVGVDFISLLRPVKISLRLIDAGLLQRGAHVFEVDVQMKKARWDWSGCAPPVFARR